MANWWTTSFTTDDMEIVELIKDSITIDFQYNKNTCSGICRLAYGIASLNIEEIKRVAKKNNSTFSIDSHDIYSMVSQKWVYENGIEIKAKSYQEDEDE